MINTKIFKAYDVRGVYSEEINEKVVAEISHALAKHFLPQATSYKLQAKIIIGRDGRLSSLSLYKTVLKTLQTTSYKLTPIPVGLITTPMLYFLVNKLKADGGIMITASHNPKEYNGLKVVGKKAKPINGTEIYKIVMGNE